MFDYETLKLIWWLLVGVLLIGFAIMDGHDMGVGVLLPIISALFAGKSASPAEQVRKVEQQVPGVVVVPVTAGGQATIKAGTGIVKPIESPSNGEQS